MWLELRRQADYLHVHGCSPRIKTSVRCLLLANMCNLFKHPKGDTAKANYNFE